MNRTTAFALVFCTIGAAPASADSWLLSRTSTVLPGTLPIAHFDADQQSADFESLPYNLANCLIARDLFQNQPGVTVKYVCTQVQDSSGLLGKVTTEIWEAIR